MGHCAQIVDDFAIGGGLIAVDLAESFEVFFRVDIPLAIHRRQAIVTGKDVLQMFFHQLHFRRQNALIDVFGGLLGADRQLTLP